MALDLSNLDPSQLNEDDIPPLSLDEQMRIRGGSTGGVPVSTQPPKLTLAMGSPSMTTNSAANLPGADAGMVGQAKKRYQDAMQPHGIEALHPTAKNGFLHALESIGIGGLKGLEGIGTALAPGIMLNVPGTRLNTMANRSRAQQGLTEAEQNAQTEAATAKDQAEAQAKLNPPEKEEAEGKTVETGAGVFQWNPQTKRYDIPVGPGKEKQESEGKTVETGDGVYQWNPQSKRYDIPVGPGKVKQPPHITYDAGIPVSVTDGKNVYDVNDPNLPANLRPLVDSANRAHSQHVTEETNKTNQGGWTIAEDAEGHPVQFNTKTGESRPLQGGVQPKGTFEKQHAITPATQAILQQTQPVKDQVDQLLQALEPYNDPKAGRLTMDRLKYALGEPSAPGELADQISKLELNRIISGARVLKGSSRAYQALERAMVHAPNPWVDKPQLMYQKLKTIKQNLEDIEKDAIAFGHKGQTSEQATQQTNTENGGKKVLVEGKDF